MEVDPMLIPPILDIILLIMSSMSPIFCICIPPCPPINPIIGIGPPEDIMVEEEEEEEEDLKLEMVEPCSDCWPCRLSSRPPRHPSRMPGSGPSWPRSPG